MLVSAFRHIASPAMLVVALACAAGAHADDKPVDLGRVDVIGTTPLPGLGTPLEQIPSNVQNFGARDLSRQRTGGVAEFLDLNANSVNLNSPTGTRSSRTSAFADSPRRRFWALRRDFPCSRTACASTRPSPTS